MRGRTQKKKDTDLARLLRSLDDACFDQARTEAVDLLSSIVRAESGAVQDDQLWFDPRSKSLKVSSSTPVSQNFRLRRLTQQEVTLSEVESRFGKEAVRDALELALAQMNQRSRESE